MMVGDLVENGSSGQVAARRSALKLVMSARTSILSALIA
jgi:hypothetical protein